MIYEICSVIATLSFLSLVIFIIISLFNVRNSLTRVCNVVEKLDTKTDHLNVETLRLVRKSNAVIDTVHQELTACSPLFDTLYNVGKFMEDLSGPLNPDSRSTIHTEKSLYHKKKLAKTIELAALSVLLWQSI